MPILWLASYPKSGNTWTRAFLANYLTDAREPVHINQLPALALGENTRRYFDQAAGRDTRRWDPVRLAPLRPQAQRILAASAPGTLLVKTHNAVRKFADAPMINPEVTAGAIYVVRNPLDVAVSYSHHLGISIDDTITAMAADNFVVASDQDRVFQYLGHWSSHVKSWVGAVGLKCHVMTYEAMEAAPQATFGALVRFLGVPFDDDRLARAIRFSQFETLAAQERNTAFVERSRHADRFFRSGRSGTWQESLSLEHVNRLTRDHHTVMERFGYLP